MKGRKLLKWKKKKKRSKTPANRRVGTNEIIELWITAPTQNLKFLIAAIFLSFLLKGK